MNYRKNLVLLTFFISSCFLLHAEPSISSTDAALLTLRHPEQISTSINLGTDQRELKVDDQVSEFDFLRATAQVGLQPLDFVNFYGKLGIIRAELSSQTAETGLRWGGGVDFNLMNFELSSSPAAGTKKSISLRFNVDYSNNESNFDNDFTWQEWQITPMMVYSLNSKSDDRPATQRVDGTLIYGGITYADLRGELGDEDLSGNRDFGGAIGASLRSINNWVLDLRGTLFDSHDRNLTISTAYHF